jgi:D-alanyl-D-alanine carboxypeptidase
VLGKEGTLAGVLADSPLSGIARAKTGALGESADRIDVRALSGFVPGADGADDLEFTMVLNGGTVREEGTYLPLWNELADALATYPEGPGAEALAPEPAVTP